MFFNSLVILMDGCSKHVTGVFHFLNLNKLVLIKVARELMILAVFFTYTYGQKLSDTPFEICKNDRLVGKWLSAQSSLTDNQWKIDIGDRNLGIRGCFIVSWEQMATSKAAAARRARATGKGREGESKLA